MTPGASLRIPSISVGSSSVLFGEKVDRGVSSDGVSLITGAGFLGSLLLKKLIFSPFGCDYWNQNNTYNVIPPRKSRSSGGPNKRQRPLCSIGENSGFLKDPAEAIRGFKAHLVRGVRNDVQP